MFKPVPMIYLRAIVLSRDERNVLRGLGALGVLQLAAAEAGSETALGAPPNNGGELEQCGTLASRIDALEKEFSKDLPENAGPKDKTGENGNELLSRSFIEADVARIEKELASLKERIGRAEAHTGAVQAVIEQLNSFKDVDLPFSELDKFSFLHFAIGSIASEKLADVKEQVAGNVVLLPLPRGGGRKALVAITSRTGRFAMETALKSAGFQPETLAVDKQSTIQDLLKHSEVEKTSEEVALHQAELARKGLAVTSMPLLKRYREALLAERCVLEAEQKFPHTNVTTLITGWVPAESLQAIRACLSSVTSGRCVVETATPDQVPGLKVPVLLRHNWFLRPFELLVAGYGLPGYHDLEPTLFVALTYMLMFGMMFGDAGHGLVLLICGLLAVFSSKARKVRDMGGLVALAGLASTIFGSLYGSFFGIESEHAPLHHLIASPLDLMKVAVGTGVVILSIGLFLNIVNHFRKHDWRGGLFGSYGVVGALFYWGAIGLLLKFAALSEKGVLGLVFCLVILLPLAIWALRPPIVLAISRLKARKQAEADSGKEEDSVFQSFLESGVETFETVLSYMTNTISFVRIAAYALSHAAVLMATFLIADAVGDVPGAGLAKGIIIVLGNLLAILLEGIIAAVQALRLEYYEFFGKFFTGGGEAFKPFRFQQEEQP